jgi:hypothetical protein
VKDGGFELKPEDPSSRARVYCAPKVPQRACCFWLEVYLVTALVPSETACLVSSPCRMRWMAVWISWEVSVLLLD